VLQQQYHLSLTIHHGRGGIGATRTLRVVAVRTHRTTLVPGTVVPGIARATGRATGAQTRPQTAALQCVDNVRTRRGQNMVQLRGGTELNDADLRQFKRGRGTTAHVGQPFSKFFGKPSLTGPIAIAHGTTAVQQQ
jgi:hypothetical protein